jgi:hypothetical protein
LEKNAFLKLLLHTVELQLNVRPGFDAVAFAVDARHRGLFMPNVSENV